MRKLIYIFTLLIIYGCSNNETKSTDSNFILDVEEELEMTPKALRTSVSTFTQLDMTKDKLQEYYDLSLLKQQHPEFENDISLQIELLSKIEAELPKTARTVTIEQLNLIDAPKVLSDSVTKIRFQFRYSVDANTLIDTLSAQIITRLIQIEGKTSEARSISFYNEN